MKKIRVTSKELSIQRANFNLCPPDDVNDTQPIKPINEVDDIETTIDALRKKRAEIIKNMSEDGEPSNRCQVIDMTDGFKEHFGTEKEYSFPSEQSLAKYAVTKMTNQFGIDARNSKNFSLPPSHCTIATDVNQQTVVYEDITANLKIKLSDRKTTIVGTIQAIQMRYTYNVVFAAESKEALLAIENKYMKILEYNNYFQGKTLRFSSNGVVFIPCPHISLRDAVLPPKIIAEYKLNVLDFLDNVKYHEITKKRALLLYGPPGGGKTTSLKALFSLLRKKNITCMYLTDDTFKKHSLESIFDFINKYLAPCCIGFEDIDLIGEDRRNSRGIIGSLLSVLNGVEDYQKPVIIVGTTNRADILDDAVTRPCRFDRKLFIDFPTTQALRQMFKNLTGLTPPEVIKQSDDNNNKLTGAHIKEICNTAKILAIHKGANIIDCVEEAVAVIKESFYLASTITGFGTSKNYQEEHPGYIGEIAPPCPEDSALSKCDETCDDDPFER